MSGVPSVDCRCRTSSDTALSPIQFTRQRPFAIEQRTVDVISDEFARLEEAFTVAPRWSTVPGPISFFDHTTQDIFFSEVALDHFQRGRFPETGLRELVAHEYAHALQFDDERLRGAPKLREFEADRFARDWIAGGETTFPFIARPTPVRDIVTSGLERLER